MTRQRKKSRYFNDSRLERVAKDQDEVLQEVKALLERSQTRQMMGNLGQSGMMQYDVRTNA